MIESYDTELDNEENEMDEYVTFYHLMTQMENSDAAWYQRLVSPLTESQKAEFKEIAKTATNCIAHKGKFTSPSSLMMLISLLHLKTYLNDIMGFCRIKND